MTGLRSASHTSPGRSGWSYSKYTVRSAHGSFWKETPLTTFPRLVYIFTSHFRGNAASSSSACPGGWHAGRRKHGNRQPNHRPFELPESCSGDLDRPVADASDDIDGAAEGLNVAAGAAGKWTGSPKPVTVPTESAFSSPSVTIRLTVGEHHVSFGR